MTPSNNPQKRLGDVCHITNGFFMPKDQYLGKQVGIPYIKSADIQLSIVSTAQSTVPNIIVESHQAKLVPKGTFLIAATGNAIGRIAQLDMDAVIDPTVCAVTNYLTDRLDNGYLYYFLQSKVGLLINTSKKYKRVNSLHLRKQNITLPPMLQQQQLAKQIDEEMDRLSKQLAQHEQDLAALEQQKQQALEEVCRRVWNRNNNAWVSLSEVARVQAGNNPSKSIQEYFGNAYPLFVPNDTIQGTNMSSSKVTLSERGYKVARPVKAGSLFMAAAGPRLGQVGISTVEASCNAQMMAVTTMEKMLPAFLYYQLQAIQLQQVIKQQVQRGCITKSSLETLSVNCPSIHEQQSMVDIMKKNMAGIEQQLGTVTRNLHDTAAQKEALLKKYF